MRREIRVALLVSAGMGLSGCAAALVGVGAAGGYAISRDAITNQFEFPMDHVYRVGREVIGDMGLVTTEDAGRGVIRAEVQGVHVTLTVRRISERFVELKVKARNQFLMPRIGVAQAVYNRIVQRL